MALWFHSMMHDDSVKDAHRRGRFKVITNSKESCKKSFASYSFLAAISLAFVVNPLLRLADLGQRGEGVIALGDVGVKYAAIVLRHFQRAMAQEMLKCKGVASAVDKIFAGEGVAEHVARGFLHASALIIAGDALPQCALCQLPAELIAEEIILCPAASNALILLENSPHLLTQGNGLNLAVFAVAKDDLLAVQVDIAVLNVADRGGAASRVDEKVDDDPIPIDGEAAGRGGAAKKRQQLLIAVCLLYRLHLLELGRLHMAIPFLVTPMEEGGKDPHIAADGVRRQLLLPHLHNHIVDVASPQLRQRHGKVQMPPHAVEVLPISAARFFRQTPCRAVHQEQGKSPLDGQ